MLVEYLAEIVYVQEILNASYSLDLKSLAQPALLYSGRAVANHAAVVNRRIHFIAIRGSS